MKRIAEPELMEKEAQARAYADADFEEAHNNFIKLFRTTFPDLNLCGHALDLGCGPADITTRFARVYKSCIVHGVDGAEAMLLYGRERVSDAMDVSSRVGLVAGKLPGVTLPRRSYDAIISNSLIHHLQDPQALWTTISKYAKSGAPIFVVDLKRPGSVDEAHQLVEKYASGEPAVLKEDFFNSLLAAYEPAEVEKQLHAAKMSYLSVKTVGDRHLAISGYMS